MDLRFFSNNSNNNNNAPSSSVRIFSPEDFLVAPFPPDVHFTGYQDPIYYSLHSSSLATHQCIDCVKFKSHVKDNHHCSSQCFISEWEKHMERHCYAEEIIRETSTGSYQVPSPLGSNGPRLYLDNDSLHKESHCYAEEISRGTSTGASDKHKERHCYAEEIIRQTSTGNCQVPSPRGSDGSWLDLKPNANNHVFVHDYNHYSPQATPSLSHELHMEMMRIGNNYSLRDESAVRVENKASVKYVANPPPNPRRMLEVGRLQTQYSNGVAFRVLSYNILSNLYASCNDHCPSWALSWEYRRQNLLKELIGYHADIICLQEVQSDHFQSFFKPQFTKYGYSALYKEKTNGVYTCNGDTAEGCATFYRHNLFREITKYEVEFGRTAMPIAELLEPEQRKQGQIHLVKSNVALVVILETVENGISHHPFQSRICVVNTHMVAGKDYSDVRLCQATQLVQGLEKIAESRIPILICGDFNSLPKSHPYKFMVKGKVKSTSKSAIKTDPFGIYQYLKLRHSLPLASAYPAFFRLDLGVKMWRNYIHKKTHEPLFTYHKPQFSGTIDYIFYTEDSLKVESVLELFDVDTVGADFLPSPTWSSDHIALMARFRLEPSHSYHCAPIPPNPWLNLPPPVKVFTYEARDRRRNKRPQKSV